MVSRPIRYVRSPERPVARREVRRRLRQHDVDDLVDSRVVDDLGMGDVELGEVVEEIPLFEVVLVRTVDQSVEEVIQGQLT